jgi:probable HAF family extracellular repeat protein
MSKKIKSSYWLIFVILTLVGCDVMEVNDEDQVLGEDNALSVTGPVIDVVELNQFGLDKATDINDKGDIIGGIYFWNSDSGDLIDVGFSTRAMNNNGQVIGREYYWDSERGLTEIDGMKYDGIEWSNIMAYDINDSGRVVGEIISCNKSVYYPDPDCFYEEWSMSWDAESRITKEIREESVTTAVNNQGYQTGYDGIGIEPHGFFVTKDYFNETRFYEGFGYGSTNAINNLNQVVGSIQVESSGGNLLAYDKKEVSEIINQFNRITGSTVEYNAAHVMAMIRNSSFHLNKQESAKGKSSFNTNKLYNETLIHLWDREKQQGIIESALASNYKSEAFIWDEENGIESIGTLNDGEWSSAFDINDHGQVVGYSDIGNDEYRAFYWDKENGMIELSSNGKNSIARAINNNGQIVGENDGPVMWEISFPQGN